MEEPNIDDGYQPQPNYAPQPSNVLGTEGSLRFQLGSGDIIEHLRNIMLGKKAVYNAKNDAIEYVESGEGALINEDGIRSMMFILRGMLDKTFILSDLEESQIENITLSVHQNLMDGITLNMLNDNPWKIRNLTDASAMVNVITCTVYATLRKAYLRGYQNFLRTTSKIHEIQTFKGDVGNNFQGPEQQKTGMMSKVPVIGRLFK